MKIGTTIKIIGEVRDDGVLVDISTWTIRADLRSGSESGTVVGSFTVTRPSTGVYQLTFDSSSLVAGTVYTDVRLIPPAADAMVTDTIAIAMTPAVTA